MAAQRTSAQSLTVHPHVRGEDALSPSASVSASGSPPRAWGRWPSESAGTHRYRFTPTCVGKMPRTDVLSLRGPGSSPRAWGRLSVGFDRRGALRFTPTCVGKMRYARNTTRSGDGSPPRAWGRCKLRLGVQVDVRFTPTCVGKIESARFRRLSLAVHPHVRGEDVTEAPACGPVYGSPPRAWGRCFWHVIAEHQHCGSPPRAWGRYEQNDKQGGVRPVHPHVRGEDT